MWLERDQQAPGVTESMWSLVAPGPRAAAWQLAIAGAVYAVVRRSGRLGAYGLTLAVLASLLAGLVIGSDLRGCPRNVSDQTCLEEAD